MAPKRRTRKNGLKNSTSMQTASATQLTSDAEPPHFPFMKLPPELRNKIYRYAIVTAEPLEIQFDRTQDNKSRFTMIPPLTKVSKTLRAETLCIFTEENVFLVGMQLFSHPNVNKPLRAFNAMLFKAGTELQKLRMNLSMTCQHLFRQYLCTMAFTVARVDSSLAITDVECVVDWTHPLQPGRRQASPGLAFCSCWLADYASRLSSRGSSGLVDFVRLLRLTREGIWRYDPAGGFRQSLLHRPVIAKCYKCPRGDRGTVLFGRVDDMCRDAKTWLVLRPAFRQSVTGVGMIKYDPRTWKAKYRMIREEDINKVFRL